MPGRPIVFLHLPKTGGQTIHHAIGALVGAAAISPHRLQSQVGHEGTFPPGYRFHSGHLAWDGLDDIAADPFVFTVLRDPRERLGSFYFYMRAKAEARAAAEGPAALDGIERGLLGPAEDFFFSEDPWLSARLRATWANLATTYLAFGRLQRLQRQQKIARDEVLDRAVRNSRRLSALYRTDRLDPLEDDIARLLGERPAIVARKTNAGPLPASESRWKRLLDAISSPARRDEMTGYVDEDLALMPRLTFR